MSTENIDRSGLALIHKINTLPEPECKWGGAPLD